MKRPTYDHTDAAASPLLRGQRKEGPAVVYMPELSLVKPTDFRPAQPIRVTTKYCPIEGY